MKPGEALEAINELDKFGINLGLDRMRACLGALGNPQDRYPSVHVGGTNGKGSTSAFTAGILARAGLKVGLYTSPPLNSFGERMRINGEPMADAKVPGLYEAVMKAVESAPGAQGMTQFELITAMAFKYFADEKVDAAVIEVGMGGRLDSTNIITPIASAVTNVGLEHAAHLGDTIEKIAREKAGIAKPGVAFSTTASEPALATLLSEAAKTGAPAKALGRDFFIDETPGGYRYKGRNLEIGGLKPALRGPFQKFNLALALSLIEEVSEKGFAVDAGHIKEAVASVKWPGRLELFDSRPPLLLDGAHNAHAAIALAEALKWEFSGKRICLVLGILDDKDAESIIKDLAPLAEKVILTRSVSKRAISPEILAERARAVMAGASSEPDARSAIDAAMDSCAADGLIVVTGSLTLVGEARAILMEKGYRS